VLRPDRHASPGGSHELLTHDQEFNQRGPIPDVVISAGDKIDSAQFDAL